MSEVVSAVVGAIAVLSIPLIAWFSRRATREGRLLARVERLGAVYGVMPASDERDEFEQHFRRAISGLNDWLNIEKRARRKLQRQISVAVYVVGVLFVLVAIPLVGPGTPAASTLGIVVGVLISLISLGSSYLIDLSAARSAAATAAKESAKAETARLDALRRGEAPTGGAS